MQGGYPTAYRPGAAKHASGGGLSNTGASAPRNLDALLTDFERLMRRDVGSGADFERLMKRPYRRRLDGERRPGRSLIPGIDPRRLPKRLRPFARLLPPPLRLLSMLADYALTRPAAPGDLGASGYLHTTCLGGSGSSYNLFSSSALAEWCLVGQVDGGFEVPPEGFSIPNRPWWQYMHIFEPHVYLGLDRFRTVRIYHIPPGTEGARVGYADGSPARYEEVTPDGYRWRHLAPQLMPVKATLSTPVQVPHELVPHRRPDPARSASERSEMGYSDPAEQAAAPSAPPFAGEWPGDGGPPRVIRPEHEYASPPAGEREGKLILSLHPRNAVAIVVSMITEGVDVIHALHDALPRKHQARSALPQDRLAAVLANWSEIPLRRAIYNLLANHLEDMLYGKAGQIQGRGARNVGQLGKTGEGGPNPSDYAYDAAKEAGIPEAEASEFQQAIDRWLDAPWR